MRRTPLWQSCNIAGQVVKGEREIIRVWTQWEPGYIRQKQETLRLDAIDAIACTIVQSQADIGAILWHHTCQKPCDVEPERIGHWVELVNPALDTTLRYHRQLRRHVHALRGRREACCIIVRRGWSAVRIDNEIRDRVAKIQVAQATTAAGVWRER